MAKFFKLGGFLLVVCVLTAGVVFHEAVSSLYLNLRKTTHLEVIETELHIDGVINSRTPEQLRSVFAQHPEINTIVLTDVPGSIDDEANLEMLSWLAKRELTTVLTGRSVVASGGTDFFLVGDTRIVEDGAKIGVHSWTDGLTGGSATDFPVGHELHQPYIELYMQVGFSRRQAEDFYYFTINAKPADGIHWLSPEEIRKYGIASSHSGK